MNSSILTAIESLCDDIATNTNPEDNKKRAEREAVKTGAWTPEEDELLLSGYQKERKTIAQLVEELNRAELQELINNYENY